MRPAILALLLCASLASFCQTAPPSQVQPALPSLTPPPFPLPPHAKLNQPPAEFHLEGVVPRPIIVLPPAQLQFKDHAQIDPKMIVHPPPSSLGEQPTGALVAQNLYPGLQFLPIGEPNTGLHPISTTWPNLKMQQIPTVWPKGMIKPVEIGPTAQPASK